MSSNISIAGHRFDVIVIGVGSMGSSACYFLAKRGYHVLGIEQFDIPHERGSHAGQSRIIRKAYFEDPGYVPLLNRAYDNWKNLEDVTGTQLYFRTGIVYAGEPTNEMIKGVKRSADLYGISLEDIDKKRFPQFELPENFEILFEPEAGFITPEKAVTLYAQQAIKNGATIQKEESVVEWRKKESEILVITNKNTYRCKKLVITAGAWAGKMIPGMDIEIKVTRQFVAWLKTTAKNFDLNSFPCWMIADDKRPGAYYGFPVLPESFGQPTGLKLAHHYPGNIADPDNVNRKTTTEDTENLEYVLQKYLPTAVGSLEQSKICLYANSPDENFIIDRLPGYEDQVVIACGFSGHGFKFVSVVGELLADLVEERKTAQSIEFLSATRFV